jgi:hypothetical protein
MPGGMSRVIQPDSAGRERNRLMKAMVVALRELAAQKAPDEESLDLAAFIAVALQHISSGIDPSVAAWEKRGYWVKADRFRLDWAWTESLAKRMMASVLARDWAGIARFAAELAPRLASINVPVRNRLGRPWAGAYHRLLAAESNRPPH